MKEECRHCGKQFENLDSNMFSSNPDHHLCFECIAKILNNIQNEIIVLYKQIDALKKNNLNDLAELKSKQLDKFLNLTNIKN